VSPSVRLSERWFVCHCSLLNRDLWVKCATASKARWRIVRAAREAGYDYAFGDVRVRVGVREPLPEEVFHG
jgi:hypothetical protein